MAVLASTEVIVGLATDSERRVPVRVKASKEVEDTLTFESGRRLVRVFIVLVRLVDGSVVVVVVVVVLHSPVVEDAVYDSIAFFVSQSRV